MAVLWCFYKPINDRTDWQREQESANGKDQCLMNDWADKGFTRNKLATTKSESLDFNQLAVSARGLLIHHGYKAPIGSTAWLLSRQYARCINWYMGSHVLECIHSPNGRGSLRLRNYNNRGNWHSAKWQKWSGDGHHSSVKQALLTLPDRPLIKRDRACWIKQQVGFAS